MVTEVRKTDVSATALKEIRLVQAARDSEAKRIREREVARDSETKLIKEREAALEAETKRIEERKAAREIEAKPAAQTEETESPEAERDYGKYSDYTVNSDHELVITVRERVTGKEIKQIPTDEELAAKHAYRRVVEGIIDETV